METIHPAKDFGKNWTLTLATAQESTKNLKSFKEQLENQVENDFCIDLTNFQGCGDMNSALFKTLEWNNKFRLKYARKFKNPLPKKLNSRQTEEDIQNILSKNDEHCKSMATKSMLSVSEVAPTSLSYSLTTTVLSIITETTMAKSIATTIVTTMPATSTTSTTAQPPPTETMTTTSTPVQEGK